MPDVLPLLSLLSNSPGLIDARNRLQEISNEEFQELAADVYDEVDRRETDSRKHKKIVRTCM